MDRPKDLKKISYMETKYPFSALYSHSNIKSPFRQIVDDQLQKKQSRYLFSAWDKHSNMKYPVKHTKRPKYEHLHWSLISILFSPWDRHLNIDSQVGQPKELMGDPIHQNWISVFCLK